ncbi:MAG: class I SAM-dependent methyltransferase [Candidatus Thermoplasmatota archaeon]
MEKLKNLDLRGEKVLDAGTGACGMTKRLEKENVNVVSVDVERKRLKECRSQTKSTQFIQADLSDLDFMATSSFDKIICNFLVSALSESRDMIISSVLREFYRVLKDDGMLIIIDYYPFEDESCPCPLDDIQVELWRLENAVAELLGEGHLQEYSPEVLLKELKALGFQESNVSTLLEEVPWPVDLLREHEELLRENLERVDDEKLRLPLERKLEKIIDSAVDKQIRSGAIYELRAKK